MNAWQKAYQGWFGGCNGVRSPTAARSTCFRSSTACNGAQFLQIKAPEDANVHAAGGGRRQRDDRNLDYYYLELRTPVDFDGTLGGSTALSPRCSSTWPTTCARARRRGCTPFLLDMTPAPRATAGFSDAGLTIGQSFTDPAGGLTITAQSVTADGRHHGGEVHGGSGDPTCMDGRPFSSPGPGLESCSSGQGSSGEAGATGGSGSTSTAGATGDSDQPGLPGPPTENGGGCVYAGALDPVARHPWLAVALDAAIAAILA